VKEKVAASINVPENECWTSLRATGLPVKRLAAPPGLSFLATSARSMGSLGSLRAARRIVIAEMSSSSCDFFRLQPLQAFAIRFHWFLEAALRYEIAADHVFCIELKAFIEAESAINAVLIF